MTIVQWDIDLVIRVGRFDGIDGDRVLRGVGFFFSGGFFYINGFD